MNAFLEIEQANAEALLEATKDHEIVKFKLANSKQNDNTALIWDEYMKQQGKIELLELLKVEFETVFKVSEEDEALIKIDE